MELFKKFKNMLGIGTLTAVITLNACAPGIKNINPTGIDLRYDSILLNSKEGKERLVKRLLNDINLTGLAREIIRGFEDEEDLPRFITIKININPKDNLNIKEEILISTEELFKKFGGVEAYKNFRKEHRSHLENDRIKSYLVIIIAEQILNTKIKNLSINY